MLEALTPIDLSILHALHDAANPVLDAVVPFVTNLGEKGFIWFAVALVLLFMRKYRIYGIGIIVAIGAVYVVGDIGIKHLVARPRPFLADPSLVTTLIELPDSFSFPSGHSSSSFAAATVLCFMPLRHAWLKAIPVLGAIAIALSRLYLCVHFPSDVLTGAVLGIAFGVLTMLALPRIADAIEERRNPAKRGKHAA